MTPSTVGRYGHLVSTTAPDWWHLIDGGVEFVVKVIPNARRSELVGVVDGILRVRLAKPPVDGQANTELIRLLGKWSGARASAVSIEAGHASRTKRIRIFGIVEPPSL